ncbi:MAG: hypothetical protein LBF27_02815 [Sphingobacterium sp.]|jgi:hypothetical protein|nr:hypothetical protein [Sphingobacterium sp.]
MMSNLTTDNPVALQALMDETIFANGFDFQPELEAASKAKDTEYVAVGIPANDHLAKSSTGKNDNSNDVGHEANNPGLVNELEVLGGEFIYQGNKDQGILFILRYEQYPYFSPAALEAFEKTIGALKLTKETVAVVNLANTHNPNDFKRIMQFFEPTKIVLLGVEPASLKLPSIEHNSYMKGRIATVFNTFSFEEMFADINKKKLFWNEFKTFIVS